MLRMAGLALTWLAIWLGLSIIVGIIVGRIIALRDKEN